MSWVSSLLTELIIPRGGNSPLGFHLSHYKPIFWLSGNWFNAQQTDIYVNVPQLRYRWNVKRIPVKWLLKIDCTVLWRLFYLMWDFRVKDEAENAILMEGWLQGLATFRLDLKTSYEVTDGVFIIFPIEYKDNWIKWIRYYQMANERFYSFVMPINGRNGVSNSLNERVNELTSWI